jgi:glycosyltransferase involved in cell wall biosynthesis
MPCATFARLSIRPDTNPTGPLVSVLLASRNGERYLDEALAGLAAQTWPHVEVVAVDDGSTDDTPAILARFAGSHPRARVVRTPGLGVAGALALAAHEAQGELLARHDDDDRSRPERLERQVRFLAAHPAIAVVGSAADIMDERGAHTGAYALPLAPAAIRRVARRDPPFVGGAVLMRRAAYQAAGGYRAAFRMSEDLDLWLRMDPATFANLAEPLYQWRRHGGSQTARGRGIMLDYAAIARAFAAERRATGRDSYALLERAGERDALLAIYPRAAHLALELATAYLRDGRTAEARAFLARALAHGETKLEAAALWLASCAVALTPRAARARRAAHAEDAGESGSDESGARADVAHDGGRAR